jgi:hypothetical protein
MSACANNRWSTRTRAVRVVALFATLFLTSALGSGPERRVQVDAAHLRETLAENLPHLHSAELKLNDGSLAKTKLKKEETDALRLNATAKVGERVIPYTDVASIRLDLEPGADGK